MIGGEKSMVSDHRYEIGPILARTYRQILEEIKAPPPSTNLSDNFSIFVSLEFCFSVLAPPALIVSSLPDRHNRAEHAPIA